MTLSACSTGYPGWKDTDPAKPIKIERAEEADADRGPAEQPRPVNAEVFAGSGTFINAAGAGYRETPEGDITLSFEGTDVRQVVKTVLGDILGENYSINTDVQGSLTLKTSQPISRELVIPTLESVLRMNGLGLVRADGIYMVVRENAIGSAAVTPSLRLSSSRGYQMLVVPLRYISASDMARVLEPVLPNGSKVEMDEARNLLVLAGTHQGLSSALDTVRIFDVNQLRGKSVGLFPLEQANAAEVLAELQAIIGSGAEGPMKGMLQMKLIERINAILVVTPQKNYLDEAARWIERLDVAQSDSARSLFVYPVENTKAAHIAGLLSQLFEQSQAGAGAPGDSRRGPLASPAVSSSIEGPGGQSVQSRAGGNSLLTGQGELDLEVGEVKIIADDEQNAIVVMASRPDYEKVEAAIRKLDVLPMQVLVEASIMEVSLTGDLAYGLEWFLENTFNGNPLTAQLSPLSVGPTFAATLTDAQGEWGAVLTLLASESKLNVVSSPSLLVLDNQTANIRVGDQVPIRTSETTNTGSAGDSPLVTSQISYRDTGVLLTVTPRVNAGGMVVMDISQQVNDVDQTTTSDIDSPTIIQRSINTSVAVKSGETVVLGGLIRDNKANSNVGIPILRDIPVVGKLFGSESDNALRTELLVMITPTAIYTPEEARSVTDEMRRKMENLTFEFEQGDAE